MSLIAKSGISCVLFTYSLFAQPAAAPMDFEAASIRRPDPNGPQRSPNSCQGGPGTSDPELFVCTGSALALFTTVAYNIKFYELIAPDWMIQGGVDGYDLMARIPSGATRDQFRTMLQRLLAERFHLIVHEEQRPLLSYTLVTRKTPPKLKRSASPPPPGPREAMTVVDGHVHYEAHNATLASIAKFIAFVTSSPAVDETGLTGEFEITLDFMPDERYRGYAFLPRPAGPVNVPSLEGAIEEQLGLKINHEKRPVKVLVVDKADKNPTPN